MTVQIATDENFSKITESKNLILIDFFATWCAPCKALSPVLADLSEELKDKCVISKHNIDEEPNCPTKFGVRGIPTMLLFKDGELAKTKVGATTKSNIKSWIEENI